MKVGNVIVYLLSAFAFLMLGCLFLFVSLHFLSFDDAILKVQEVYQSTWRSVQAGVVGLVFITLGLTFAKMLVKEGRPNEAIIFHSGTGLVVVSAATIENTAIRTVRHFSFVKSVKVKATITGKNIELRLRLFLWSGGHVPTILAELQQEVQDRVKRLLGPENQLVVTCDVRGVEEVSASKDLSVTQDH